MEQVGDGKRKNRNQIDTQPAKQVRQKIVDRPRRLRRRGGETPKSNQVKNN
jgi:hypothetical protein